MKWSTNRFVAMIRGPRDHADPGVLSLQSGKRSLSPASAHVASVPERIAPRLGPHGQPVRFLADGDTLDLPRGGVDGVNLAVVPTGQPQGPSIRADIAHVGAPAPGAPPCHF